MEFLAFCLGFLPGGLHGHRHGSSQVVIQVFLPPFIILGVCVRSLGYVTSLLTLPKAKYILIPAALYVRFLYDLP